MRPLSKRLLMGVTLLIFLAGALVIMLRSTDVRKNPFTASLSSAPALSTALADTHEALGTISTNTRDETQNPDQTAFFQAMGDWAAEIRESEFPEHLLAAALLEKDTRTAFLRLQRLLQEDPFHPLLNMTLAEHCLELPDPLFCNEQLRNRLMSFDGDNGKVRDLLALLAWQSGDTETSLNELRESAYSHYSDDLWADHLQIIGESLHNFGLQERNPQLLAGIIGYTAASAGRSVGQLLALCKAQIANADWRSACQARGLNLAQNGRTLLLKGLGASLVQAMSGEDDPLTTQAREYLQQPREEMEALLNHPFWHPDNMNGPPVSDSQWQKYLDIFRSEGEAAAFEYLTRTLADLHTNG